jgi:hypothetical protein
VAYPLLVAILPTVWVWQRHRRAGRAVSSYPSLPAFLITVPFVVDLTGNALDFYDRIDVFDDACHLVNWATLSLAVGIALVGNPSLPSWAVAGLCTGFGATTAVLWEIGEYGAFVTNTPERFTLYRDTMADLALGLLGSAVAGLICLALTRRRREQHAWPAHSSTAPADHASLPNQAGRPSCDGTQCRGVSVQFD